MLSWTNPNAHSSCRGGIVGGVWATIVSLSRREREEEGVRRGRDEEGWSGCMLEAVVGMRGVIGCGPMGDTRATGGCGKRTKG